jgi:hypothetical protein
MTGRLKASSFDFVASLQLLFWGQAYRTAILPMQLCYTKTQWMTTESVKISETHNGVGESFGI